VTPKVAPRTSFLRSLAKSRLVHFVAAGLLLAAAAPKERDDRAVVVDARRVEDALRAEQARRGRPLSSAEKTAAVRDVVDEEILARDALRIGLGSEDAIVRARLADRMRASFAQALPAPRIAPDELDRAIAREIERSPERVRFDAWFVSKDRPDAASEAESIARAIRAEGPAKVRGRGGHSPLPDGTFWTEESLARVAGAVVARGAMEATVGKVTEPLSSAWGFYVLLPLERRRADPSEVRTEAHAALTREKQATAITQAIRRARRDYTVEVRSPSGEPRFDIDALPPAQVESVD
jgi:peptidyl-prolyl cis-trans isomerase C